MMFQVVLLALYAATLTSGEIIYHVRPASAQRRSTQGNGNGNSNNPNQIGFFTHSDDGFSNTLPSFLLRIFETPRHLTDDAKVHVESSLNDFILTKLNGMIENANIDNKLFIAENTILSSESIDLDEEDSDERRLEEKRWGTEFEMRMKLIFDYEPTPFNIEELNEMVKFVMENLDDFVTRVRDTTIEDLQDVTSAQRKEIPGPSSSEDTSSGNSGSNNVESPPRKTINQNMGAPNSSGTAIRFVPGVMAGTFIIAIATYFIFRKKRQEQVQSPKGDMLYVDVENDLYSMDRSLESDDPNNMQSPVDAYSSQNGSSIDITSPHAGNSLNSESPAYANNIRGSKSLMSGLTETSATTIRVSNVNGKKFLSSTPKSLSMAAHSSLFAFSEEGEEAYQDDMSDKHSDMAAPPSLAKSDVSGNSDPETTPQNLCFSPRTGGKDHRSPSGTASETSSQLQGTAIEHPPSVLGGCNNWYGKQVPSPSDVLADLAELASARQIKQREPTPMSSSHPKAKDPSPRFAQSPTQADKPTTSKSRDPSPRSGGSPIVSETVGVGFMGLGCIPTVANEPCSPARSSSPVPTKQRSSKSPGRRRSSKSRSPSPAGIERPLTSDDLLKQERSPTRAQRSSASSLEATPLIRNTETNGKRETPSPRDTVTPGSQRSINSQKSAKLGKALQPIHTDVEEPETVGQMSGKATRIIGGVFGVSGSGVVVENNKDNTGNRSRASTIDGGSRHTDSSRQTTPKSVRSDRGSKPPTPNGGNSSRTSTPNTNGQPGGKAKGGGILNAIFRVGGSLTQTPHSPSGDSDYVDNLSRPSTPGGDFNTSLAVSDYVAEYTCSPYGSKTTLTNQGEGSTTTEEENNAAAGAFPTLSAGKHRRHAGDNMGGDGSAMYQTNAMHPLDWSYKSGDVSTGESTISENDGGGIPRQFVFSPKRNKPRNATNGNAATASAAATALNPKSPMSYNSKDSRGSGAGVSTLSGSGRTGGTSHTNASSQASASRQLINDLVWLEKKIANVRGQTSSTTLAAVKKQDPPAIDAADSLSYVSNDAFVSPSSNEGDDSPTIASNKNDSVMSSIVCRDCYAPPGKLHIVIHSTKDGPSVHTVKEGSSLEGHIFPGDLIIAVDDVDTRSYTAEQVMKMMAAKSSYERKLTVLHFEEEE